MKNGTVTPARTYALVVGIEKYALGSGPGIDLDGPAHDAYTFADWLVRRGVPRENIALLLSPLESNTNNSLDVWSASAQWPATRKGISDVITRWLPKQTGDLLWVFWGGHGVMTATRKRRLFYADTTTADWHHLDLESLLTYLSSDNLSSFQQQIYLIDTCANYQRQLSQERLGGGDRFLSGVPVRDREQFVFFATREGEVAKNLSQEQTGLFSKMVLEELAKEPSLSWPPDMEELAGRVRASFSAPAEAGRTKQTPIFASYRIWDGTEYIFGQQAEQASPVWNVPFPRKQFFTGREALLKQLHTQLRATQTAALGQVISGLGGIGKTQLAVEYAYRYQQEYQTVLWAYAEKTEALTTSYTEIAKLLQLSQKDAQKQEEIVQGVKDWLSHQQNWLLILDNADEPKVLIPFLPPKVKGHLIVTTRAADLSNLGLGFGHALTVKLFTKKQDVPFLLRRAGLTRVPPQDRARARQIADELGGLPLALNQAGAYLAATDRSLVSYWDLYQKQRATLLNTHLDHEYPRSVAATLLLSFRQVEQRNPAAADLLRLCAFLAPDAIPEELLMKGARGLGDILAPVAADAIQFDQAFVDLRAYSLLTRDPQTQTFTVHRLVQAVLRDSMDIETQQQWMQQAILAVNAACPDVQNIAQWDACERWLPHSLACAVWIERTHMKFPEARDLLYQTAYYLSQRARYAEAEPLFVHTLQIREQQFGPEHPLLAYPLNELAILYFQQGKYAEAEHLYLRTLQIREQQFGPEHPDVATSLNGLAILYKEQGKYTEAEHLCLRALHIREQQFGFEHPDVATSLNNLAVLYYRQGRYAEAEPLYLRALQIREQQFGPEHPQTAEPVNNLAELYREQSKYAEAEFLYLRALRIWEQQLGPEYPLVTYSLHGLGELYREQGQYAEAEPLYLRALRICEQQFGPEHPQTAEPLNGLGDLYLVQGQYAEAEPLLLRVLQIRKQQWGSEHPRTQLVRSKYISLLRNIGRDEEARKIEENLD